MAKLTDIQIILLTVGAQREDGSLLPPPASLDGKGAQIRRAIRQLIKRGLAADVETTDQGRTWREEDNKRFGIIITEVGKQAIGAIEPPPAAEGETGQGEDPGEATPATSPAAAPSQSRPETKQAKVLDLLRRDEGASLDELVAETGWLPHTTRAALTGFRKRGIGIDKTKLDGVTRYKAGAAA